MVSCNYCNKQFQPEFLDGHISSEHGIRYPCEFCDVEVTIKSSLRRHINRAHPEFKLSCHHCNFTCTNSIALKSHIKAEHETINQKYYCKYCGKSFDLQNYLKRHINGVHKEKELQCK